MSRTGEVVAGNPGFGIYAHWPFCLAKCPYCDFNSHVNRSIDQAAWRAALVAELTHMRGLTGHRRVETLFFGGGTPSLMPPETVAAIIEAVGTLWSWAPAPEITLEANPTSVDAGRFGAYAAAGVNRVSIGVQALDDSALAALGRTHTVAEARAAFDIARRRFERVSFDLIYARAGQTLAAWRAELGEALDMAVDHLSLYQLAIEEGTRFFDLHRSGRLVLPDDGLAADMYDLTGAMAETAGLPAYEISNHARPGAESRHNLIYWRSGEWVGAGPGAHGRIDIGGVRTATETLRDPRRWLAAVRRDGHALRFRRAVAPQDRAAEYLLMALRLGEGVDLGRHRALGGELDEARLARLAGQGLLRRRRGRGPDRGGDRLIATPRGRLVLDRILAEIAVDPAPDPPPGPSARNPGEER